MEKLMKCLLNEQREYFSPSLEILETDNALDQKK